MKLTPHGLDQGSELIELAKQRLPDNAENFHIENVWDWQPKRRYSFVYMLYDCLPIEYLAEGVSMLMNLVVAPRGRLIIGAYGSKSDATLPFDIGRHLESAGFEVAGRAEGGFGPITKFAWMDA